jgi:hypothetical protein
MIRSHLGSSPNFTSRQLHLRASSDELHQAFQIYSRCQQRLTSYAMPCASSSRRWSSYCHCCEASCSWMARRRWRRWCRRAARRPWRRRRRAARRRRRRRRRLWFLALVADRPTALAVRLAVLAVADRPCLFLAHSCLRPAAGLLEADTEAAALVAALLAAAAPAAWSVRAAPVLNAMVLAASVLNATSMWSPGWSPSHRHSSTTMMALR